MDHPKTFGVLEPNNLCEIYKACLMNIGTNKKWVRYVTLRYVTAAQCCFVLYPLYVLWVTRIVRVSHALTLSLKHLLSLHGTELSPQQKDYQAKLQSLTLNATAIWEREAKHYGGDVSSSLEGPWIIKLPYLFLCYMLDTIFEGRYVPSRFLLLETVARMPYFSYIGMLHMYETLGFWRRSADVKRIHFAQEINEFRHLLIMESLGGDQLYWVRFMAQHAAIFYFLGLCLLFTVSPSLSYQFSEWLETHAVSTYGQFVDENEILLKELPPSLAAVEYYVLGASDPYYAEFQTSSSFLSNQHREVRECICLVSSCRRRPRSLSLL